MAKDSVDAAVEKLAAKRNKQEQAEDSMLNAGWLDVCVKKKSFHMMDRNGSSRKKVTLHADKQDSVVKIFEKMLPPEFLTKTIQNRIKEDPAKFIVAKEQGKVQKMNLEMQEVFQYLSCRILVHGNRGKGSSGTEQALISAKHELEATSAKPMIGKKKLMALHRHFVVRLGTDEEKELSDIITSMVSCTGPILCCDEKLYYFTGDSDLIRMVISKPARIGLWFFQSTIELENGLPFLVSTNVQAGKTPTTVNIKGWTEIAFNKGNSVVVMDQYYMANEGRAIVVTFGAQVIAGLNQHRFREWSAAFSNKANKRGQSAFMHNLHTGETLAMHYPQDRSKPRQLVYSTAFQVMDGPTPAGSVPVYDHYKVSFSICDRFNRTLHGKGWPFQFGGNTLRGDDQKGFDYLLSSILINTHHTFCFLKNKSVADYPWSTFTKELSQALYNKYSY